jgi:hypothetical protein
MCKFEVLREVFSDPKVSVLALCWPQAGDIAVADTKPTPDRSVLFIIGRKSDRSRQRQKNLK